MVRAGRKKGDIAWWLLGEEGRTSAQHTAAGHKETRNVFKAKQAEPGGGGSTEGGDWLERVACDGLMLARNEVQCVGGRWRGYPLMRAVVRWARLVMLERQRHDGQAWWQLRLRRWGVGMVAGLGGWVFDRLNGPRCGLWTAQRAERRGRQGCVGERTGSGEDENGLRKTTDAVGKHVPFAPESYQPHYYYSGMLLMAVQLRLFVPVVCVSGARSWGLEASVTAV